MAERTVTDTAGRSWTCSSPAGAPDAPTRQGHDVTLTCATVSVEAPVYVTVGWQWETMAANGLARVVNLASPVARA